MKKGMTKAQRYLQIAAKYTPEDVIHVPVEDTGDGHRGRAHLHAETDDEGNDLPRRLEAPVPNTVGRLRIYLHECAHFTLGHENLREYSNDYSRGEAEANLEVMRIFDEEGLVAPLRVLKAEENPFFSQVLVDDKRWERHPTVIKCLEEFERRKAVARARERKK
jgi:hypothetical protein